MWDGKGTYEDYIAHHGVVGMKWGVRRGRNQGASKLKINMKDKNKPKASSRLNINMKKKDPKKTPSFTEGQGQKADVLMTQKDRKRNMDKIKSESKHREAEWNKLYLKREKMGDRELQLALNRLRLENQFAKEVKSAGEISPPAKTFLQKHSGKIVIASKGTEMLSNVILAKDKDNQNAQLAKAASKALSSALSGGEKKK